MSFLFLVPAPVLAVIYDDRMIRERGFRIPDGVGGFKFDSHFSALTEWLGSALIVVLVGGMIVYVAHSVYLQFSGRSWLWIKLLVLPLYFVMVIMLLYHAD